MLVECSCFLRDDAGVVLDAAGESGNTYICVDAWLLRMPWMSYNLQCVAIQQSNSSTSSTKLYSSPPGDVRGMCTVPSSHVITLSDASSSLFPASAASSCTSSSCSASFSHSMNASLAFMCVSIWRQHSVSTTRHDCLDRIHHSKGPHCAHYPLPRHLPLLRGLLSAAATSVTCQVASNLLCLVCHD